VTEVIDGDSIKVEFDAPPPGIQAEETIRLLGIAAPELNDKDRGQEAENARDFVAKRTVGSIVYLAFESKWRGSFGRLLAYVFTGSGSLVNAELLSHGLASVYSKAPCHFHQYFLSLEVSARLASLGMWSSEQITDIVIRQVFNEGRTEYVEIWNSTGQTVTLSGWYILDEGHNRIDIPPDTSIPANGILHILSGSGTMPPSANYVYPTKALIWNNDGDTARLFDEDDKLVTKFEY
jgi:endonuclease YncB( thermonuclease family)